MSRRLVRLAEDLSASPTASLPQACQGWAETKAAYRFFAREALDWRAILQPHWKRTAERMRELSCEVVFAPEEWQAAWIVARRERPSSTPPTLAEITRIVAGFGGFLGRKNDGHPGPKALWAGLQKLRDYVDSIHSLREAFDLKLTYG